MSSAAVATDNMGKSSGESGDPIENLLRSVMEKQECETSATSLSALYRMLIILTVAVLILIFLIILAWRRYGRLIHPMRKSFFESERQRTLSKQM